MCVWWGGSILQGLVGCYEKEMSGQLGRTIWTGIKEISAHLQDKKGPVFQGMQRGVCQGACVRKKLVEVTSWAEARSSCQRGWGGSHRSFFIFSGRVSQSLRPCVLKSQAIKGRMPSRLTYELQKTRRES